MPNVNDFNFYCSKLGIDHMEVLDDVTYADLYHKDGVLSDNYSDILKMSSINMTTYDKYRGALNKENIVFFIKGKVKNPNFKGKFIGQIIREIEERTENEAQGQYYGSEGVKQFLTDLINGELILNEEQDGTVILPISENTMYVGNAFIYEQEGLSSNEPAWVKNNTQLTQIEIDCGIRVFKETQPDEIVAQGLLGIRAGSFEDFLGKIQQKVNIAKEDMHSNSLSNIAFPWLYTKFGIYPTFSGQYGSKQANVYGSIQPSTVSGESASYNEPAPNAVQDYDIFSDVWELVETSVSNDIEYKIKLEEYGMGKLNKSLFGVNSTWHFAEFLNQKANNYSTNSGYYIKGTSWWQGADVNTAANYRGVASAGGYDLSADYCGIDIPNPQQRIQKYTEKPFIIGIIFWVTEIKQTLNNQYALCYAIPVGFNGYGQIIPPNIINSRDNFQPSENTYQFPINFNGYIALPLALNMTEAEYSYATAEKSLIVPVNCLPNDNYSIAPGG